MNTKYYNLFFPGRRVRAHLQNPATKCDFPIGYFIFLLTLEKCAILECTVNQVQAAIFVSSCFSFPFVFCVYFVLCPFIYFLEVKKFLCQQDVLI
jgi:hypothetical protein